MQLKILNVCNGKELKSLLEDENGKWISFNERMIEGEKINEKLFTESFCQMRSKALGMSLEEYKQMMKEFLEELSRINEYDCIRLWYYEDWPSVKNAFVMFDSLAQHKYKGGVIATELDSETKEITFQMSNREVIEKEQD